MPDGKKSYLEFAKAIKVKYPDYKDVDDFELASKMVEKYPEYADQVDLEPLPSTLNPEVKNTSAPSVLVGGTSGLAATPSASQNQFDLNIPGRLNPKTFAPFEDESGQVKPYVPAVDQPVSKEEQEFEKQVLEVEKANKFSIPTDAELKGKTLQQPKTINSYSPLGKRRQVDLNTTVKTDKSGMPTITSMNMDDTDQKGTIMYLNDKKEEELKDISDFYDKDFVPKRNLSGLPISDKESTVDFYMEYLKSRNPDEYNYTQEKLKSLQDTVDEDKKTGEDKEDTSEDQLALERYKAEIQSKAFELKTKAFKAKYSIAENNIDNYFREKVNEFNSLNSSIQKDYDQLTAIKNQLNSLPKNDQGQIILNAANRKETEALIQKQNELLSSFDQKVQRQNEIKQDSDFMDATQLMSDVQKNYNDVSKYYYDLATNNPDAYRDLPEYKRLIEQKKKSQKQKDILEESTGGDLGIMESVSRAVTNTVSKLAYIPKSLTSNSEYGWTDKLYDITKNNIDDFNDEYIATPKGLDKPILEDGNWNLKYLPGKVAGAATDMAIMVMLTKGAGEVAAPVLSGEAASSLGSVVSGYVMSASGYYDEAKDAGMSEKEAVGFSRSLALQQAILELVSPNDKLLTPGNIKDDVAKFTNRVANGATRKEAIFETTKEIINKVAPEVTQENLQLVNELVNKYTSKELSGELSSAKQSVGEQMIETSIITALTTLGIGGKSSTKTTSSLNKQALYMAAYSPDKVLGSLEKMLQSGQISDQKAADVLQKITVASEALGKMDKNIPVEKQIDILPEMMNKLIKEQEEKSVDSNFKNIKKEEVADIDEKIQNILSGTPEIDDNDLLAGLEEELLNEKEQKNVEEQKTKKTEVLTTEEENKMQKEGLFEVDKSEEIKPIELTVEKTKKETKPLDMEVTLPPQIAGGLPRKMVFKNGEWKESVGGELTSVSKNVQEIADKAFNEQHKYESEDVINQEKQIQDDTENKQGLSGEERIGKESIEAKPEQTTSAKKTEASGVLQTQKEVKKEPLPIMKVGGQEFYVEVNDKNIGTYTSVKTGAQLPIQSDKFKALENMRNKKPSENITEEEDVTDQKPEVKVSPKVVSDLIDLASKTTVLIIDKGGYDFAQAVKKAVAYVKAKNPKYQKLVDAGIIDEDTFEKEVEAALKKEEPKPEEKKDQQQPVDKKEKPVLETGAEEKSDVSENKNEEQNVTSGKIESQDFSEGEKKKKKSIARIESDPEFKNIRDNVSNEDVMYSVTKKKRVAEFVNRKLDEFEKDGILLEVAMDMAEGKNIFPDVIHGVAYGFMAKRIAELSERNDVNPSEADMLMSVAGKLYTKFTDFGYNAGVQASLQDVVNKELGTVSSSEALTREAVHQKVKKIQEESLTEKEKTEIKQVNEDIKKEWELNLQEAVKEKIAEMSKAILGEEKANKASSFFSSLKNNLKDC